MDSENQLAELGVLNLRALKLETCVILMCDVCGEIWSLDGLDSGLVLMDVTSF